MLRHLLAAVLGMLYFLGLVVCAGRMLVASEGSRWMSFFLAVLLIEALLGAVVYGLVKKTSLLEDSASAKVIIFVAMGASALYGGYWGGPTALAGFGLAAGVFTAPCLLPILAAGQSVTAPYDRA